MPDLSTPTPHRDPSDFKHWPLDVLKVYSQLPLPPIYDFVLANEKVASELRRQNRDMHKMVSAIIALRDQVKNLDDQLQMDVSELTEGHDEDSISSLPLPKFSDSEEEDSEEAAEKNGTEGFYPAWEVDMMRQGAKIEQRQWEEIYIAMLEVILQTFEENESTYTQSLEILREAQIHKAVESALDLILKQHNDKIKAIRDQMFTHIKDIDLEPIIPLLGDLYDEDIHRVIETIPLIKGKGKRNAISRIIRIGYRRHGELVRQADVCVYG